MILIEIHNNIVRKGQTTSWVSKYIMWIQATWEFSMWATQCAKNITITFGNQGFFYYFFLQNTVSPFEGLLFIPKKTPIKISFSKFYEKAGVMFMLLFHLIWKNYILYTEILTRKVVLGCFFTNETSEILFFVFRF